MQTLIILEYQAMNDGSCAMPSPATYTDETTCLDAFFSKCASAVHSSCDTHTVMIVNSEGECWRGYKQTLRHGHEVVES